MLRVIRFTTENQENAAIAFNIRQRVFVDEQKVSRDEEYDSHEDESSHYLLLVDETPAGTARWRFTDKGIKLERFAVLPEFRNHGAGSYLVQKVLEDVLPQNKTIYLHAQVAAINLYSRAGFKPIGELFYEANIPHYKMIHSLEV
jgi:predicted GNAT family N-acyltransferase